MTFACLEEHIAAANPTRFMDVFVENSAIETLGFEVQMLKNRGPPEF